MSELELTLETSKKKMTTFTSKYDTGTDDMRPALERAEVSAWAKG